MNRSWEPVKDWYDNLVGDEGHYYHQNIIIPAVLKMIKGSVLDLACGQGILSRHLPETTEYLGVDLSKSLIDAANKRNTKKNHRFLVSDVTDLQKEIPQFDCVTLILAIQDIDNLEAAFTSAAKHTKKGGTFIIVMNHPCFRIPRQSAWGFNEQSKLRFRTLNAYMSQLSIPIKTNPGKEASTQVIHHHRPLHAYFNALHKAGFLVSDLEEWISNKESTGKFKKAEDRARAEFPLFLCIKCIK